MPFFIGSRFGTLLEKPIPERNDETFENPPSPCFNMAQIVQHVNCINFLKYGVLFVASSMPVRSDCDGAWFRIRASIGSVST